MSKITLHIGLHKTGTSYIQEVILGSMTDDIELIRGWYTHRQLMKVDINKPIIISDEGISGSLWNGSYLEDFNTNIKRIKEFYGDPKIMFGIREHSSFIFSVYKQYLHQRGYKDFSYIFNEENKGILKFNELEIYPKIKILKENFSDVFIYSQESLFSRKNIFIISLLDFLEVKKKIDLKTFSSERVNEGVSTKLQVKTLKRLNILNHKLEQIHPYLSLYSRPLRKLKLTPRDFCQKQLIKIKSDKIEMEKEIKDFIKELYQKDWELSMKELSY